MTAARLRLAFYGDDFTGSTDALEVLAFAGVRSALFLEPPSPAMLARFEGLEAVGVAGDSRAMTPAEMDAHLPGVFDALSKLGARIVHYKVCSTFDSGTSIGSIGRVMEIARPRFPTPWLPVVAGTPRLGRWCLFGNLFARAGTDREVYRIDRHPIMSVHPVTPMTESDLTVHLAAQGNVPVGSLSFDQIDAGTDAVESHLAALRTLGKQAVVLDAVHDAHLTRVGELLQRHADQKAPLFVVGSSGVEYALTQHWHSQASAGGSQELPNYTNFDAVNRVLALSGSASTLSAQQIKTAVEAGFADLPLDAAALVGENGDKTVGAVVADAAALLLGGRSVMMHTARGPDDPRIARMLDAMQANGLSREKAKHQGGRLLGVRLGTLVRGILQAVPLKRLLLSGGDTSSQVTKLLAPDAIVIAARLAPGAPLCRLVAAGRSLDGLEVALKGGQMGSADYFVRALHGSA